MIYLSIIICIDNMIYYIDDKYYILILIIMY